KRRFEAGLQVFPSLLAGRANAIALTLGIGPSIAYFLDRADHLDLDIDASLIDLIEQPLDLDRYLFKLRLHLLFKRFFSAHPKPDTVSMRPKAISRRRPGHGGILRQGSPPGS